MGFERAPGRPEQASVKCPHCGGSGKDAKGEKCKRCNGTGYIRTR
jgi:DnaJ-class molecular chaperone